MKSLLKINFLPRVFSALFIALFLISCGPTPSAEPETVATKVTVDPLRFADAIQDFKRADSANKPLPNSVLFVGSSSIRGWRTLPKDFPELNVINRGFGGSHMSDLLYYLDDLVFPYNPNAILVYEGDNDIADGKSPQQVYEDYATFVQKVRTKLPNVPIFFISIKPSLARLNVMDQMAEANALIKAQTDSDPTLFYVDVFNLMLNGEGEPRGDIFVSDGLHLNGRGYSIWTRAVKAELGL